MNISTRLILLLTLCVGIVMLVASVLSLYEREQGLENALRGELRAHAITLQTALEENYAQGRLQESENLIDRLRKNSKVYAVLLFKENGELVKVSQPASNKVFRDPPELKEVLRTKEPIEFIREVDGQNFLSVILPLKLGNEKTGAIEMVKPIGLIKSEIFNARVNWIATTLFLLAVIFLVVIVVLKTSLINPLESLIRGVERIGKGDLEHRVAYTSKRNEIGLLGKRFNLMTENLQLQKQTAEKESANRLELERSLRHSERLASVGRLAAGVAHELGAPLNVIDGRAERLLKNSQLDEKTIDNISKIKIQGERITSLVRQLLDLSRPYEFQLRSVNIYEHVQNSANAFAEDHGIEIKVVALGDTTARVDPEFLGQVWTNLFLNAKQASESKDSEARIEVRVNDLKGDDKLSIEVEDNSGGIAEEHIERIFDPFYTTKDIGKGTGLGLSVSHRIIEEHRGEITVKNNADGTGAIFSITLPRGDSNE